jgi:hypothetical protein
LANCMTFRARSVNRSYMVLSVGADYWPARPPEGTPAAAATKLNNALRFVVWSLRRVNFRKKNLAAGRDL